ncbi:MAG: hypothetical protein KQI78_10805 [Deltaproteobacteria bacterium]|nr:hypothetical protein [Deltaproteobacteria bacterium]
MRPLQTLGLSTVHCSNPECHSKFDVEMAQDSALKHGMSFAIGQESIYQIVKCPNIGCDGRVMIESPLASPLLDMRGLLLMPVKDFFPNAIEQAWLLQLRSDHHKYLHFDFIEAWEEESITENDFIADYGREPILPSDLFIEDGNIQIFTIEDALYAYFKAEQEQGKILIRRLFPNSPYYRNLLLCLSPLKLWQLDVADGLAEGDLIERPKAWKSLIEGAVGTTFSDAVKERFVAKGIDIPDDDLITQIVNRELFYQKSFHRDHLWDIVNKIDFEEHLSSILKSIFASVLNPALTELALQPKRKELTGWVDEIEEGKALFVDAPMGLGKTYSIVETLSQNPGLSAIVFMPTKKLCTEVVESLKTRIAAQRKISSFDIYKYKRPELDANGSPVIDEDGFIKYKFKEDFLEQEVYYADGINPNECQHYDAIVKRYKLNWIKKKDICNTCSKKGSCRFLQHQKKIPHSRIVITTHHQYDHFYQDSSSHYWTKNGGQNLRDLFIVDEDLVLSLLYQPINLNYDELNEFIGTITDFLQEYDEIADLRKSIYQLSSNIGFCGNTSIIRSIDPEFTFPDKFVTEWEKSLPNQAFIIPEYLNRPGTIGNHLKLIEHAVRYGAVVEKWGNRFKIHLPNPRSYDLSKTPPHAFFDGTMLNENFLAKKLKGVEFKQLEIDIKSPWDVRIFQNTNSDLPERWIERDKPIVQGYLSSIINCLPGNQKIYLVTTNAIMQSYVQEFLDTEFPGRDFITGYFGNIRGINDAKDCDIGIMLGSFIPSDAVEVAMALEFVDPDNLDKDITATINNLWTWKDTNGVRKYNEGFTVIGQMAGAYRHSEHRQALARTRYLFHDVDFYIVSKDQVSDYDPFLQNIIDDQYRGDLFQPRPKRPEAKKKFDEIAEKVFEWLKTHDTVIATDIYNEYGIRRQTVSNKLKLMYAAGQLEKASKTKYRLPKQN